MNKPVFVISCPIDCYSGYSSRSRDIVKAIIELDKYDVKILSQKWGNCPWGFIEDNPEWGFLTKHILPSPQLNKQPEIWAQITVPNEFQPIGKYNIGITAGIETTICAPEWIEGLNRMDLTLVSSEHAKTVFKNSKFEKRNKQTNATEGVIELIKPVEVIFEGADLNVYKPLELKEFKNVKLFHDINSFPEDFCYLYLGHWMQGEVGEDRKNVGLLIKSFYETFKNTKKRPALILKTSMVGSSYVDREEILKRIKQIRKTVNSKNLPNIYLLHGEFSDSEINEIYNHPKVKAMINLTKGEGFGRPLLEFTLSKKPLITTNWSGHVDFLNPEFTPMIGGTLTNVHPSSANQFLLRESQWFSPDITRVNFYLKDVFENYKNYESGGKRQGFKSKNEFSWDKMKDKAQELFTKYIPEFPSEQQIILPKLKQSNTIHLPKLIENASN